MTPERQKWWNNLSSREKFLRNKILCCKMEIKEYKDVLNNVFDCYISPQKCRDYIRESKYTMLAFKHELEYFNKTTKANAYEPPWNTIYSCGYYKTIIRIDEGKPNFKFCPCCGRRIKNRKD